MLTQTLSMASPDVHVIERIENKPQTIRVGAYCRVSTDMEVQKRSMETQMMAYEQIIDQHPGWTLAGIYADQGLSGTGVNRRTEFLRMITLDPQEIDDLIARGKFQQAIHILAWLLVKQEMQKK